MNPALDSLLQQPGLWRARHLVDSHTAALPTGFRILDAELPGGGWPRGALTEILLPQAGIGELRLVLPALAALSQRKQWLAWIAPPYIPYAPALVAHDIQLSRLLLVHPRSETDTLWAIEQALRSSTCGAALAWAGSIPSLNERHLRRLQLAAEAGDSWGIIFGSANSRIQASPAALRLLIEPRAKGVAVHILKRRGGWPIGPLLLELDPDGTHHHQQQRCRYP